MERKHIKQVREAVREGRCFKIKAALDLVSTTKDYRMTANAAKYWYSEARLPRDQQIRYLVSRGNLITLKATTENEFYNAITNLRFAYRDAVEEVEIVARDSHAWQQLTESEKNNVLLEAYARNSEESRGEDECRQGQKEIGRRNKSLSHGSPEPQYDLSLLRRIRSGLKYWDKKVNERKAMPTAFFLDEKNKFLQHLDEILG